VTFRTILAGASQQVQSSKPEPSTNSGATFSSSPVQHFFNLRRGSAVGHPWLSPIYGDCDFQCAKLSAMICIEVNAAWLIDA
jgi:hypothetical protein